MNDDTLKTLLSAYAAPAPDDGFSDRLLLTIESEAIATAIDVEDYQPASRSRWRSWVVTLILGFIAGLIWARFGITLPDIPSMTEQANLGALMDTPWTIYVMLGLCLAGTLLFLETEAY